MRVCTGCKVAKPLDAFSPMGRRPGSYYSRCKPCEVARGQAKYAVRKAKAKAAKVASQVCEECGVDKPASEFRANYHRTSGLHGFCKPCQRAKWLKQRWDMTEAEFEEKLESQGGVCCICGRPPEYATHKGEPTLVIDHCHATGRKRDLLCGECNKGLGAFQDDPERMQRAIEYLAKWAKAAMA